MDLLPGSYGFDEEADERETEQCWVTGCGCFLILGACVVALGVGVIIGVCLL